MEAVKTIVCVLGTRPEAIKMAPVISQLRNASWARCVVIATAQHRGLLDQALDPFGITPDLDLDLMVDGQNLADLTGRMVPALSKSLETLGADAVLAQGDTASVFCASLAAFYDRIPFGHVEAGLRTNDLAEPFPEEGFRQMVARLTKWHFAPTTGAARNLELEGVPAANVFVTGNTGIDALLSVTRNRPKASGNGMRTILLTAHRRESFGAPMAGIFAAVRRIVDAYPDIEVIYPVHPNPNVATMASQLLGGHPRIALVEPMGYVDFTTLMARCFLVLTDSGGIQEEAPALGKPVLVLRDRTERPEAIEAGVAKLVGTNGDRVVAEASQLLDDPVLYAAMAVGGSPYGDGRAAPRIAEILREHFDTNGNSSPPVSHFAITK